MLTSSSRSTSAILEEEEGEEEEEKEELGEADCYNWLTSHSQTALEQSPSLWVPPLVEVLQESSAASLVSSSLKPSPQQRVAGRSVAMTSKRYHGRFINHNE